MNTRRKAQNKAKMMTKLKGTKWLHFKADRNSPAGALGLKYGICEEFEKSAYEAGGCEFIEDSN